MTDKVIVTIELALIMVFPLIIFYQRMKNGFKSTFLNVVLLYLIWFFSYALLHELCHVLGSWITGAKIGDYQLIPRYWEGDYKNAYVGSIFENGIQGFISPISPYIRDIIFLFVGYVILKGKKITGSFVDGLIVVLFVLSPIYDIFNNYFGFVLGARNDFSAIRKVTGSFWTHTIGLLFTLTGIFIFWRLFVRIKNMRIFDL